MPVLGAQIGIVGALAVIAVFNPVPRVVDRAETQVDADDIFASYGFIEFDPFVRTDAVGIDSVPCQVDSGGAFVFGSDSILPIVTHGVIPAGPPHVGDFELLHRFNVICPEAILVGQR